MRTVLHVLLSVVLVLLLASAASAQEATLVGYGIYQVEAAASDPSAAGGRGREIRHVHVETTRDIPLTEGVRFGFSYRYTGAGGIEATARLAMPDGRVMSGPVPVRAEDREQFLTYSLGSDDLAAGSGECELSIEYQGQRLLGMAFNLYNPRP